MERTRILFLKICIPLIIGMGLFPPWTEVISFKGVQRETPIGHHLIFVSPKEKTVIQGFKVDTTRLLIYWFLIIVGSYGLSQFRLKPNRKPEGSSSIDDERKGFDEPSELAPKTKEELKYDLSPPDEYRGPSGPWGLVGKSEEKPKGGSSLVDDKRGSALDGRIRGPKFFVLEAWRGRKPLALVFWVYFVGGQIAFMLAIFFLVPLLPRLGLPPTTPAIIISVFSPFYIVWIFVSLWRCAANSKPAIMRITRILVIILAINTIAWSIVNFVENYSRYSTMKSTIEDK
jgi:hypothetical protein